MDEVRFRFATCPKLIDAKAQVKLCAVRLAWQMRIFAASGDEVACFDAGFDALVERRITVGSLKRHLADSLEALEETPCRFQLRILKDGDSTELQDDEHFAVGLRL